MQPKRMMVVAIAAIAFSQGCVAMQAGTVEGLRKQMPYAEARANLLTSGWKPASYPASEAEQRCGARKEICVAYRETTNCSGTGRAYCAFIFNKESTMLQVTTVGEEFSDLTVDSWAVAQP